MPQSNDVDAMGKTERERLSILWWVRIKLELDMPCAHLIIVSDRSALKSKFVSVPTRLKDQVPNLTILLVLLVALFHEFHEVFKCKYVIHLKSTRYVCIHSKGERSTVLQ